MPMYDSKNQRTHNQGFGDGIHPTPILHTPNRSACLRFRMSVVTSEAQDVRRESRKPASGERASVTRNDLYATRQIEKLGKTAVQKSSSKSGAK